MPSCTCGRWNAFARSATRAELVVVALAVAGQQHPQRVVEVVGPGGVAAPARSHHLRVVHAGLGDHERRLGAARDGGDEVLGVGVLDRVHGVEPQPVEVEVADPLLGALQRPLAHRVRVLVVVVDRLAPRRLVVRREVRAERAQRRGAGGADVVVDDVEQHGQALAVRGVDELLQPVRPAVGGLRGGDVDAVVAPAVAARELADRHHLDRRDAELAQLAQVRDRGLERALGREGADVQLVEDELADRRRAPVGVGPRERAGVEQARRAAQARPAASASTGRGAVAVEHELVVRARLRLDHGLVNAVADRLEVVLAPARPQRDPLRQRRPDAEARVAVAEREGTEAALEGQGLVGHEDAHLPAVC